VRVSTVSPLWHLCQGDGLERGGRTGGREAEKGYMGVVRIERGEKERGERGKGGDSHVRS